MKDKIFFQTTLIKWVSKNKRKFPWRKSKVSRYEQIVAEIMLKKTAAAGVIDVYRKFFSEFPSLSILSKTKLEKIERIVKPLGLHKSRSILISRIPEILKKRKIKSDYLLKINGIGQYVASSFCCFYYGHKEPIVDTNVIRLLGRYFGKAFIKDPRRDKTIFPFSVALLPKKGFVEYNYALIDFPALICKASKPSCNNCPLKIYCHYYRNTKIA
jgi:A/G-specific adenine glycosylase|tara:strand:- start:934 stop:1575 length:642 start_codon:yes stop_codon:yes gene_type:complete